MKGKFWYIFFYKSILLIVRELIVVLLKHISVLIYFARIFLIYFLASNVTI